MLNKKDMDYFDEMREEWGAMNQMDKTFAAASHGVSPSEVERHYIIKDLNKLTMKRDLLVALAIFLIGALAGSVLAFAIIPPKITHEIYLYRPKVKNSEKVEFLIQQIETDTVLERKWLRDLFRKRKGGKQ